MLSTEGCRPRSFKMENYNDITISECSYEDSVVGRLNSRRRKHVRRYGHKVNFDYILRHICVSQETCLDWLKNRGFIPKIMFCITCQRKMKFERSEHSIDGYLWICKECPGSPSQLSARHGSWLESRDAPLLEILIFTYMWANGGTLEQVSRESNMSMSTVKDWNVTFLNIIASVYEKKLALDDEFATENGLEKKMAYASMWRRKNKHKDLFIEFLKIADSL